MAFVEVSSREFRGPSIGLPALVSHAEALRSSHPLGLASAALSIASAPHPGGDGGTVGTVGTVGSGSSSGSLCETRRRLLMATEGKLLIPLILCVVPPGKQTVCY